MAAMLVTTHTAVITNHHWFTNSDVIETSTHNHADLRRFAFVLNLCVVAQMWIFIESFGVEYRANLRLRDRNRFHLGLKNFHF